MFNLTIVWVREQYYPFPNTEILLILEDELFVELSITSSLAEVVGYCPSAFCTW